MTYLSFFFLFLLFHLALSLHYPYYLSGKKPMMKADLNEADLDKDMCAPVTDSGCGPLVAVIVDKGDYNFKCVMPCRFFANMSVDETFKCPDMDCTVTKFYKEVSDDQFFVHSDRFRGCQNTEGKVCCKYWAEEKKCLSEVYDTPFN